jgi:hypothetical protein
VRSLHFPYQLLAFCQICQVQFKNKPGLRGHEQKSQQHKDRLEAAEQAKQRARDDEPGPSNR